MPVVSLLVVGLQRTLSVCYHLTADTVSVLPSYSRHCQYVTIALGESSTYLYVDEIFLRWVWFHLVLFSCFVLHQIIIIFLRHEKMRRYTLGSVFHGMILHSLLNQSFKIKIIMCVFICIGHVHALTSLGRLEDNFWYLPCGSWGLSSSRWAWQ